MKSLNLAASDLGRINTLLSLDDAAALINAGAPLAVAGRQEALDQLPQGKWIGGTTPYFLTGEGGQIIDASQVFVTDFSGLGAVDVVVYDEHSLQGITDDAPENGFALAILPFQSAVHHRFAAEASSYPQAFLKPTVGWIAGFDLGEAGAKAYVYNGLTGEALDNRVAVLHVALEDGHMPTVEIVNIFEADGVDVIRFTEAGFAPAEVVVNGETVKFADYVRSRGREDGRLPLVGDYSGARVNSSIRLIEGDTVHLYAPVFPGIDYSFAAPVADYAAAFQSEFAAHSQDGALWSCNCILNFLFGELEGKTVGSVAGPVTFGEVAYQLVNQTLVQVRVL
jgi:hypothetical protein